jgi:hypothetical protein
LTNPKTSIADWFTETSGRLQPLISRLLKTRINRVEFLLSLTNFAICITIVWFVFWYLGDLFSKDVARFILLPVSLTYLLLCTLTFLRRSLNRIIDTGNGILTFLMLAIFVPPLFVFAVFESQNSNLPDGLIEIGRSLSSSGALLIIPLAPLLAKCLLQPTSPKFTEVVSASAADPARSTPFKLTIAGALGVSGMMLGALFFTDTIWLKRSGDLPTAAFYSGSARGKKEIIQCNNVAGVAIDPESRASGYSGMSRDGFKDANFIFSYNEAESSEGYIDVTVISPIQSISLADDGMRFDLENRPIGELVPNVDLSVEQMSNKQLVAAARGNNLVELPLQMALKKIRDKKPDTFTISGIDESSQPSEFQSQRIEKFVFNKIDDYGGYQLTYIRHLQGNKNGLFGMATKAKYDFGRTSIFLGTCMLTY